jgi:hypothetical protein
MGKSVATVGRFQKWAPVNTAMNLQVPEKAGIY